MSRRGQNFAGASGRNILPDSLRALAITRQSSWLQVSIAGPAAARGTRVYLSDSNTFAGLAVDHF
jgi:hypothetical protein